MISLTKDKRMLGYEALAPYPDISCFVTTRHGGCSTGNYASFNCTPYTGDHPDCVRKNQELLCAALPFTPRELVIPFQTHGISSLIIDETYLNATHSERQSMLQGVDALITRTPRCCICISTADCIPILLYDKEHHAIAAVHAGWRGTVRHILAHTLRRMQATCGTEGKDIIACIGPGISFASLKWETKYTRHSAPKVSRWNRYPRGNPKRTNTTSTYGKPTICSSPISGCLPGR